MLSIYSALLRRASSSRSGTGRPKRRPLSPRYRPITSTAYAAAQPHGLPNTTRPVLGGVKKPW